MKCSNYMRPSLLLFKLALDCVCSRIHTIKWNFFWNKFTQQILVILNVVSVQIVTYLINQIKRSQSQLSGVNYVLNWRKKTYAIVIITLIDSFGSKMFVKFHMICYYLYHKLIVVACVRSVRRDDEILFLCNRLIRNI